MNILFSLVASAFVICIISTTSKAQTENDFIQTYLDGLEKKRYNPKIAPEGNNGPGSPIDVLVTMYILDVHKIDDFNMEYKFSFYFRQSWNDTRLAYQDEGTNTIHLRDYEKIWIPDLFIVQEIEGSKHNVVGPNVFVRVKPNGEVHCSIKLTETLSCPMDLRAYPHDIQKCEFTVESYGKNMDQLGISWDMRKGVVSALDKTNSISVWPFELTKIYGTRKDSQFKFNAYRVLHIELTFERQIGFYMTRLYIPFIILVAMSWLSFWIKPKIAYLRLTLLLVIEYLLVHIGSDINSYIPPAPYVKASDIWIAVCESLVFASFLEFVLVIILAQSEKKFEKKRSASASDAEAPIITESDIKDKSSKLKAMGHSSFSIVVARLASFRLSSRVDTVASILFPVLFLVFNAVYWIIY